MLSVRIWGLVALIAGAWPVPADGQTPVVPGAEVVLALLPAEARSNFNCASNASADSRLSVSCYDLRLGPIRAEVRALAAAGLRGSDLRQRLCREVSAGRLSMPGRALTVQASGSLAAGAEMPDSLTVYYLLQMPGATAAQLGIPGEEIIPGRPFLHHGGTCDAHLMWWETIYPGGR